VRDAPSLAVRICDRHRGVGGDGLLVLGTNEGGAPFLWMFNPDGTEDFCGNGLRCAASYLLEPGETRERELIIFSPRGRHEARVRPLGNGVFDVEAELVVPQFDPEKIPVRLPGPRVLEYPLEVGTRTIAVSCVSTGTAHTAIFGPSEVEDSLFREISPLIERHAVFPERTSVLWCRAEGRERIRMRIWERGVGETLSCGTGVAAAAAIGRTLGVTGDRAEVVMKGGRMVGEWRGEGPARVAGPARIVYTGAIPERRDARG
jgi:diaminopimelate epimerase